MAESGSLHDESGPLDQAENEDDETRLAALENLHSELESELERDAPRPEPGPPA